MKSENTASLAIAPDVAQRLYCGTESNKTMDTHGSRQVLDANVKKQVRIWNDVRHCAVKMQVFKLQ